MDGYELHGHLSEQLFSAIVDYFANFSSSVGSVSEEIHSRQAVYFSYTYEPFSAISGSATIFWVISYYRQPVYTPCTSHGEMIIHVLNSGIEVMGHDL